MAEKQKKTKTQLEQEKKETKENTNKIESKTVKTASSKTKAKTTKEETTTKETKKSRTSTKPKEAKASKTSTKLKEDKTLKKEATPQETKTSKAAKATKSSTTPKVNATKKESEKSKENINKMESKSAKATVNKSESKTVKKSSTKKTSNTKLEPKKESSAKVEIDEVNIPKKSTKKENNKKSEIKDLKQSISPKNKMDTISKTLKENSNINNIEKENSTPRTNNKKVKNTEKKYFDISIGSIIAIIVILLLIILNVKLGIHSYNIIKGKNTTKSANADSQIDNTTQEIGHVLNKKNEIVKEIVEKMTFIPNATASIYKAGEFNTETVTNDLKLRLGWAKLKEENKLRAQKENGEEIIAVEKEKMQESIKNIFGTQIQYIDQSFNNTDVKTFAEYSLNPGVINYNSDLYVANPRQEGSETNSPFIYQEIQKLLQYNDKIVVHVKASFVDVKDGKYILYKDYNNSFKEELVEILPEELLKDTTINKYTGEGTITLETNAALDSIRDKLNTYTYTFSLDEETNEYYLSEFNKLIVE